MNVLITGGTGSFGRAFAKRLLKDGAERICIYSRSEHVQAEMREALDDKRLRWFIGDVRDRDRLRRAFEGIDTVIHAAALKRIEVGFYNPIEMVKTNVLGATNVIEAAMDAGVEKVVALSTDKAYQPISPYGQTKALMESLVLSANNTSGGDGPRFSVTRYGNVAGSKGSVIPKWRAEIEKKGMVTVTDPNCTRFWMTMNEAVDLVLDTIEKMPDKIAIPSLPGFQLRDLAEALGTHMITRGLPRWEKMHESLTDELSSDKAPRMSVSDLQEALKTV
jgi:UDP-N-acetylglucosamine 4,6-dehydratase/5-epimerase